MTRNLSDWYGWTVRAADGDVGTVEQFYFDDLTWMLRYLAVNTAGAKPGRHALISVDALGKPDREKRVLPVNLTLGQVRSSPDTNVEEPVSRRHEVELHEHYAWPLYWNGGFYVPVDFEMAPGPDGETGAAVETPSVLMRKVDPHLRNTRDVKDCVVRVTDGTIGRVDDFLVDDDTWSIRYLIVNTRNWKPNRRVPVAPRWIKRVDWAGKTISVNLSREAIKQSPEFVSSEPITPEYEGRLIAHLQKGNINEWVLFKVHAPAAANVSVAGTFNDWEPAAIKLGYNSNGVYTTMVLLPLGRYEYKYVVNGEWRNGADGSEQTPNAFGTANNVLHVGRTLSSAVHRRAYWRPPVEKDSLIWSTPTGG